MSSEQYLYIGSSSEEYEFDKETKKKVERKKKPNRSDNKSDEVKRQLATASQKRHLATASQKPQLATISSKTGNLVVKTNQIETKYESDSNSDLDGLIVDDFSESEEDSSKSIHKTKIETKKKKSVISKDSDESETNSDCFILDNFIESEEESAKSDSENVELSADSDFRFDDFEWCFEEIFFQIISFLQPHQIIPLNRVSKQWKIWIDSENVQSQILNTLVYNSKYFDMDDLYYLLSEKKKIKIVISIFRHKCICCHLEKIPKNFKASQLDDLYEFICGKCKTTQIIQSSKMLKDVYLVNPEESKVLTSFKVSTALNYLKFEVDALIESNREEFNKRRKRKSEKVTKLMDELTIPPEIKKTITKVTRNSDQKINDLRICHQTTLSKIPIKEKMKREETLKACLEKYGFNYQTMGFTKSMIEFVAGENQNVVETIVYDFLQNYGFDPLKMVPKEIKKKVILKMFEENDEEMMECIFESVESKSKTLLRDVFPNEHPKSKDFTMNETFLKLMNDFMIAEKSSEPPKKKLKK